MDDMQYMDADDWSEASTSAMSLIAAGEIPLRRDRDTGMLRRDARGRPVEVLAETTFLLQRPHAARSRLACASMVGGGYAVRCRQCG
jgi:hypothetical protein